MTIAGKKVLVTGASRGIGQALVAEALSRGCPARKLDLAGDLRVFRASCGVRVLVDQAVEDGFSADLPCVDVGYGRRVSVAFVVRDALGDALVRPGRVVMRLVVGQDGTQVLWVPKTCATWADALGSRSVRSSGSASAGPVLARPEMG